MGGNDFLDDALVKELYSLYNGHTVLDLGCGLGAQIIAALQVGKGAQVASSG